MPAFLAAPLILPFAQAAGLAAGTVATVGGLELLSKKVQSYMESNPENTQKIMAMIMPAQGIASMLKNKSVKETEQGLIIGGEPKEILPPPKPFSTPIDLSLIHI